MFLWCLINEYTRLFGTQEYWSKIFFGPMKMFSCPPSINKNIVLNKALRPRSLRSLAPPMAFGRWRRVGLLGKPKVTSFCDKSRHLFLWQTNRNSLKQTDSTASLKLVLMLMGTLTLRIMVSIVNYLLLLCHKALLVYRRVRLVCHKNKWRDLSQKLVTSLGFFIEGGQENILIGQKYFLDQWKCFLVPLQ